MVSVAALLSLGFLLGMRHATDPDHVVAIATIVARQRGIAKAGLIGVLWGLGHTLTIFVVGAVIILFQVTVSARVGLSMELAVAAMLILLGVLNLTGTLRRMQEAFNPAWRTAGAADTPGHENPSTHESSGSPVPRAQPVKSRTSVERLLEGVGVYGVLRPIAVGIVHGLAGSAAVALLVMSTLSDPWWAIGYLFLFGVGTIVGMMLITLVIAVPFALTAAKFANWNRGLAIASGCLSLGFGLFLSYQIGVVGGLFTAHPQWTPR